MPTLPHPVGGRLFPPQSEVSWAVSESGGSMGHARRYGRDGAFFVPDSQNIFSDPFMVVVVVLFVNFHGGFIQVTLVLCMAAVRVGFVGFVCF